VDAWLESLFYTWEAVMKTNAYELLAAREQEYWWHRARRQMVRQLLHRYEIPRRSRWLDLGCGTGGNLELLGDWDPKVIVGVDLSPVALELAVAKNPHVRFVRADIGQALPFADAAFDLVTSFNVLYHAWIEDERAVLAEVRRVLRAGGVMLATEPAFAVLARALDEVAMTRRRYRWREWVDLCRAAGLEVVFISYFTSFGFPLILAMKMFQRLRRPWSPHKPDDVAIDMRPLSRIVNALMFGIAKVEADVIAHGVYMPFGTTLVCLAHKY
jgi:SAM-dependent methyltransferase